MLLPAAILVLVAGALVAWFAGRRLPRPWNRVAAVAALAPGGLIVAALAAGLATGWLNCADRPLWQRLTDDGRFLVRATAIACEGGQTSYNVVVEEQKPDGGGKVRAIWRSFGSPVPDGVDHRPPATFAIRAHDGSPARLPVPPAEVTLEGKDLAPSRMWSFHLGRAI